jgi:hypothetical protein
VGEEKLREMKAKKPEHLAPLVSYLVSDASSHVTGQFLRAGGDVLGVFSHPAPKKILHGEDGGWTVEAVARAFEETLGRELETPRGLGEL